MVLRARAAADPFGDLFLEEEDALREQGPGVEGLEQDGGGDGIGEVPDELRPPGRPPALSRRLPKSVSRTSASTTVRFGTALSRRRGTRPGPFRRR